VRPGGRLLLCNSCYAARSTGGVGWGSGEVENSLEGSGEVVMRE